jgi:hypothetical protein
MTTEAIPVPPPTDQAAFLREGIRQALGRTNLFVDDLEMFNHIQCVAEAEEEGEEIVHAWTEFTVKAWKLLDSNRESVLTDKNGERIESVQDRILRLIEKRIKKA